MVGGHTHGTDRVIPPRHVIVATYPELLRFVGTVLSMPAFDETDWTSWYRDPVYNKSVGGVPMSWHTLALGLDGVHPDPPKLVNQARARGLVAIDFGSHVHIEPQGSPHQLFHQVYG